MKIVATYDYTLNLGSGPERVERGQEFTPPGTGVMNREEQARSLIAQGAALTPEAFAKSKLRADSFHELGKKQVAEAEREAAKLRKAREIEAEKRRRAAEEGAR